MVKKSVKKKATKKKLVKTTSKFVLKKKISKPKKLAILNKKKFSLSIRNLVLFVILSLISYMLHLVSQDPFYTDLFYLLSMILGFIAFAFFIVVMVLLLLKLMRNK